MVSSGERQQVGTLEGAPGQRAPFCLALPEHKLVGTGREKETLTLQMKYLKGNRRSNCSWGGFGELEGNARL